MESSTIIISTLTVTLCISSIYKAIRATVKDGQKPVVLKFVIVLSSINFVVGLFLSLGTTLERSYDICNLQGFIIQCGWLTSIILNCFWPRLIHEVIVKKEKEDRMIFLFKFWFRVCIAVSLVVSLILLSKGVYAPDLLSCWIGTRHQSYRFSFFYVVLLIALVHDVITLTTVANKIGSFPDFHPLIPNQKTVRPLIQNLKETTQVDRKFTSTKSIIKSKLMLYLCVSYLPWFPLFVLHVLESTHPSNISINTFSNIASVTVPCYGFLIVLFHGRFFEKNSLLFSCIISIQNIFRAALLSSARTTNQTNVNSSTAIPIYVNKTSSNNRIPPKLSHQTHHSKKYNIFTTTLNMGECTVQNLGDVSAWIPRGHDIYAIALQECLYTEQLIESISHHLNDERIKFHSVFQSLGSSNTCLGYHGFISVVLFIRSTDLISNKIQQYEGITSAVATGMNLIVTTASNKGAVGLAIKVHDTTTIAFISVHLPSDLKAVSYLKQRNKSARAILRELQLTAQDTGCDLQFQFDHVIIMGDLNYRTAFPSHVTCLNTLAAVAEASRVEMLAAGVSNSAEWMKLKYSTLLPSSSLEYPMHDLMQVIRKAKYEARRKWDILLATDELTHMMAIGEVFHGFVEAKPRFPPSYKRKRGLLESYCTDYSDLRELRTSFEIGETVSSSVTTSDSTMNSYFPEKEDEESHLSKSGSSWQRHHHHRPSVSLNDSFTSSETRSETRESAPLSRKARSKIRPPSYTDRIVWHSLPDRADRLVSLGYEICDEIRGSDHRPVSSAFQLEVETQVPPTKPSSGFGTPKTNPNQRREFSSDDKKDSKDLENDINSIEPWRHTPDTTILVELVITDLSIDLDVSDRSLTFEPSSTHFHLLNDLSPLSTRGMNAIKSMDVSFHPPTYNPINAAAAVDPSLLVSPGTNREDSDGKSKASPIKIGGIRISFPFPNKDPIRDEREFADMASYFGVHISGLIKYLDDQGSEFQTNTNDSRKRSLSSDKSLLPLNSSFAFDWDFIQNNQDIRLQSCISPEVRAHTLIKVVSTDGLEVGQCVIPLTCLMEKMHTNHFEHLEANKLPMSLYDFLKASSLVFYFHLLPFNDFFSRRFLATVEELEI